MSKVPAFDAVLFFSHGQVQAYISGGAKGWKALGKESRAADAPASDVAAELKGKNLLCLVSDAHTGHVQMVVENSKASLADDNLGKLLVEEYDIDLDAYEFASQRFTISRETTQVSVSGIEKPTYNQVVEWTAQLSPKKVWVMPFGWFVSVLKSVEPALIAVVLDTERVLVSHHYLGVDDAREIKFKELAAYGRARKQDRRDTHLLYVQTKAAELAKIRQQVGETMAVHELLPSTTADSVRDVVSAVMERGVETLAELLHFEVTSEDKKVEAAAPVVTEPEPAAAVIPAPVAPATADLPLPDAPESASALPRPRLPVVEVLPDEPVEEAPKKETKTAKAEKVPEPEPEVLVEPVVPVEQPAPVSAPVVTPPVAVPMPEQAPLSSTEVLAQLKDTPKVTSNNNDRYVPVQPKSRWPVVIMVFLFVALGTGLVGGALFWSNQGMEWINSIKGMIGQSQQVEPSPMPSPSPLPTVEPTPVASPSGQLSATEKAKYKVTVLNATGIAGLAGKQKTKLETAGWKSVGTGNADGVYKDATFVYAKDAKLIPVLEKDLGVTLTPMDKTSESAASTYDIVIILGEQL